MGLIKDVQIENHDEYEVMNVFKAKGSVVRAGKVVFQENARIPDIGFATHDEDEYVCVVKGAIEFGTEEDEYNLKEGDFHFMPKGKSHWCKNSGNGSSELMFVLVE